MMLNPRQESSSKIKVDGETYRYSKQFVEVVDAILIRQKRKQRHRRSFMPNKVKVKKSQHLVHENSSLDSLVNWTLSLVKAGDNVHVKNTCK